MLSANPPPSSPGSPRSPAPLPSVTPHPQVPDHWLPYRAAVATRGWQLRQQRGPSASCAGVGHRHLGPVPLPLHPNTCVVPTRDARAPATGHGSVVAARAPAQGHPPQLCEPQCSGDAPAGCDPRGHCGACCPPLFQPLLCTPARYNVRCAHVTVWGVTRQCCCQVHTPARRPCLPSAHLHLHPHPPTPHPQLRAADGSPDSTQRALATAVRTYDCCEAAACAAPALHRPSLLGRVAWWLWNRQASFVMPRGDASYHPARTVALSTAVTLTVGATMLGVVVVARARMRK